TAYAINHVKAAEVPIVVAVYKVDRGCAIHYRIMQELSEYDLVADDWGGDTIFVSISAIHREVIDDLLHMILLIGEVQELTANPYLVASGTVIDDKLDKGRGSVATLLVQDGALKIGQPLVVGNTHGRVRAMVSDLGERVK